MTLGGGCEIVLHAARVQASAETYMGLVEAGVGLIPAGGGCKEMLLRTGGAQAAFDLIGYAKVSRAPPMPAPWACCAPGRHLHESRAPDGGRQGGGASLVPAWTPPGAPRQDIAVEGEAGYALLKIGL